MRYVTEDTRIASIGDVISPVKLHAQYPISDEAARLTLDTRSTIHRILVGEDDRLLVIVGPCSIHDPAAALEYAKRLLRVRERLAEDLLVIMRVYFEKPRTTVGWKGLINDPDLDNSYQINKGLSLARSLLLDLNEMGMPAGTEFLDLLTPQYLTDLVSWGAIGARTTESQLHREMASGLSCPVGFKNGTNGDLRVAIDAVRSAMHPHHFLSMTQDARSAIFSTTGNDDCHVILRGGRQPNYDSANVAQSLASLEQAGLRPQVMIDCSHANSNKVPERQVDVANEVAQQIQEGESRIVGVMIESHLVGGRQDVEPGRDLVYGQSITDACLGWDATAEVLELLATSVRKRRALATVRIAN